MPVSEHTLHAIGRTLFHSLWIGVIIAVLAGLVITLTKKASPRLRYHLFCGLLLLFIGGTAVAFFWEWGSTQAQGLSVSGAVFNFSNNSVSLNNWTGFADRWSPLIVGAWLLGTAVKSIRLAGELVYLRKVRQCDISEVSVYWQRKTTEFARCLHIRKNILLLESALIRIPVTIGYLRPLILLPAGTLLQLTPEQVESILYHELAHILRRDYLINIVQRFAEAVFFFNPAIWWLSALIREEREACCDDLVLTQVPQKRIYLEALMAFQHNAPAPSKLAMGLRRPQLMNRLRRMVSRENQPLHFAEKIVLLASFALLLIFTVVPKANQAAGKGVAMVSRQVVAAIQQLAPARPVGRPPKPSVRPDIARSAVVPFKTVDPEPKFHPTESGYTAAKERARAIITALVAEKVISRANDIAWFGISSDELIVNGQKQPEALHQKLKATFAVTAGNGVYYGPVKMQGKGDFFDKADF